MGRPQHKIYIIFIHIKPFSEPLYPVDGDIMTVEETTPPIRTEMFHYGINVISQNNIFADDEEPNHVNNSRIKSVMTTIIKFEASSKYVVLIPLLHYIQY